MTKRFTIQVSKLPVTVLVDNSSSIEETPRYKTPLITVSSCGVSISLFNKLLFPWNFVQIVYEGKEMLLRVITNVYQITVTKWRRVLIYLNRVV